MSPLERALPPLFLNSFETLRSCGQKFRAVGPHQLAKEHSLGTRMRGITGYRDPLAGLDGVGSPTHFGEIQPPGELDGPFRDSAGLIKVSPSHRPTECPIALGP